MEQQIKWETGSDWWQRRDTRAQRRRSCSVNFWQILVIYRCRWVHAACRATIKVTPPPARRDKPQPRSNKSLKLIRPVKRKLRRGLHALLCAEPQPVAVNGSELHKLGAQILKPPPASASSSLLLQLASCKDVNHMSTHSVHFTRCTASDSEESTAATKQDFHDSTFRFHAVTHLL